MRQGSAHPIERQRFEQVQRQINESIENSYSLFNHLCRGILIGHDPHRIGVFAVSAHSVYMDDAGHPVDKNVLTVAGFLATQDRWEDFRIEWNKALATHRITPPFHAVDFFYERRSDKRFQHILDDLVRIIGNHVIAGFSASLDVNAYRSINASHRLEEALGTPYAMATTGIYQSFDKWKISTGFSHPTLFFTEDGTLHRGDMQEVLRYRDSIVPPILVPKDVEPCQAADLYAYVMYQYWNTGLENETLRALDVKMRSPGERIDTMLLKHNLEQYLTEPRMRGIHNGGPEEIKIAVPLRRLTEGVTFNFIGNTKILRRRRVK